MTAEQSVSQTKWSTDGLLNSHWSLKEMKYPARLGQGWVPCRAHLEAQETDSLNTQTSASEPLTSIRTTHLFSVLIETNGCEAHVCMLCGNKTWGAVIFLSWLRFNQQHTLNWLKNTTECIHRHLSTLPCLENQSCFSVTLDNGWKGQTYLVKHGFIWNDSVRSIWPLLNDATCCNRNWKFLYLFIHLLEGIII